MVSSGVFVCFLCLAALAAADVESPAPVQVAVGAQVAMMKPGFVSFNIDFDNRPSQLQVCSSPPTPLRWPKLADTAGPSSTRYHRADNVQQYRLGAVLLV